MYAQTLMLAMTANGLASCAQGTMGHHPDLVREAFGLGSEVKVLFGISFGYEDVTMAVNNAHTERASLADTVTFRA
jgi:nitroreductase